MQSSDHGQSWSDAVRPHTDGTPTEHGFVSVYPEEQGTGLLWLDGRKMINEAAEDPTENGMTLRSAILAADGSLQGKSTVDELICDCCQTDVAIAADGPVAVYRNRTTDEIRDVFVTRFVDGAWLAGVALANDNWHIAGCPVNGPAGHTVGGQAGPIHTVGRTALMRIVPQLVRVADKLIVAWTDKLGDSSEVLSIEIPILGLNDG
jgi:hypothetical protein